MATNEVVGSLTSLDSSKMSYRNSPCLRSILSLLPASSESALRSGPALEPVELQPLVPASGNSKRQAQQRSML